MAGGSKKLPAFQFYPGDWMKDPALRACSLSARGLWADMLCLLFEMPRRGFMEHSTGAPVTEQQIARMVGCDSGEFAEAFQELKDAGVFSCNSAGVIYSRRMVRDEEARQAKVKAGSKGGSRTQADRQAQRQAKPKQNSKQKGGSSSSSSISSSASAEDKKTPPAADSRSKQSPELDEQRQAPWQPDIEVMFLSAWEAAEGRVRYPHAQLSPGRRQRLMTLSASPAWDWRAALAKFPLRCTQGRRDGWRPSVGWFLKDDSVDSILEGAYDWSPDSPGARDRLAALERYGEPDDEPEIVEVKNYAEGGL